MKEKNEAWARTVINDLLRESNWDIQDTSQVKQETNGKGRSDYLLMGKYGPLCIVEAKRASEDPYNAKEQAKQYAEEAKAPFIILSNGFEHLFWDYLSIPKKDVKRIEKFPSREDLECLKQKRLNKADALLLPVPKNYFEKEDKILRGYQLKAIKELSTQFDSGKQSFLIEMATGTGKTLVIAAIIRRFLESRNAHRVLFIVDRINLAQQAIETFKELLPEYKTTLYRQTKNKLLTLYGSSIVVATIQSLMSRRNYRDFGPFYFDLIINDEAHRSIYGAARECIQYFHQATRIGLTATPKSYLKNLDLAHLQKNHPKQYDARVLRDTYKFFGCEIDKPTFQYSSEDAIKDEEGPFLCQSERYDLRTEITTEALEENGWIVEIDGEEETFPIATLEKKISIPARNEVMCQAFLDKALKSPDKKVGKSIIFAVNQNHATAITKILNRISPGIAITITSRIRDSGSIAKEFRKGNRTERIAVTVDMLATGYDCPQIRNIGLMRPIFSPTQYFQIKGRGTRLYSEYFEGKKYDKDRFMILDFCAVCEYFEEKYDFSSPLQINEGNKKNSSLQHNLLSDQITSSLPNDIEAIPIWEGNDRIVIEKKITIPTGEQIYTSIYKNNFEKDLQEFSEIDNEFRKAVEEEDEHKIEQILHERFFHRPKMFYSTPNLVDAYELPAPTSDFVYHVLKQKKLISISNLLQNLINPIISKENANYFENKWLNLIIKTISENPEDLERFIEEDPLLYDEPQFTTLGGITKLYQLPKVLSILNELRQMQLIQKLNKLRR